MIGGTLYLVIYRVDTGEFETGANSCQMCKKLIINAGISKVIIRGKTENEYEIISVDDWIKQDDLLDGKITY